MPVTDTPADASTPASKRAEDTLMFAEAAEAAAVAEVSLPSSPTDK
jgi:hypothetical protein